MRMKLGKAFSDSVHLQSKTKSLIKSDEKRSWWLGAGRVLIFSSTLFVAFFILIWRLFDLTVVQGHHFRALADENRTRELVRHAPRGILLDRTGKPIAQNIPQYRLLSPCEGTAVSSSCVKRLTVDEGKALSEKGLPGGTYLEVDYLRQYVNPDSIAHVVGYTGELSEKELNDDYYQLRKYAPGDRVGRVGAEAVYEDKLRGRNGRELVEVNAEGKALRTLGTDPEIPGTNITLSIDADLSRAVADAFPTGQKGAVIVSKPDTGEVLALYSSPSFSPNAFTEGISPQAYKVLADNPDRPMFDRALGGVYPPGSTFKLVVALAGLEEGAFTKDTQVEDTGVITIGPFSFPNWYFLQYGKKEGNVDLAKAIARSNDIYFYKLGEELGITKIAAWAHKVGIGKPLGIELGGEASGTMPDPAWKNDFFRSEQDKAARNNLWYLGDTYHVSIGQGYVLTTPIQVNTWTNIIANGGKLCKPTIEKSGSLSKSHPCAELGIKKETIDAITEGMAEACATGGTGWPLFDFKIPNKHADEEAQAATASAAPQTYTYVPIACKTGTAEFGHPLNHTHAWFTSFAPFPAASGPQDASGNTTIHGTPEISVTVLVEGAGEGSSVAGPIAKEIFEYWFSR